MLFQTHLIQRAVENFLDCETYECVMSLRDELTAIKNGRGKQDVLDALLGKRRAQRWGDYQKWAKQMLVWMAQARR